METRSLPDHDRFTPVLAGIGEGKPVLLTEKDAVKCLGAGWENAAWVEVAPRLESGDAAALVEPNVRRAAGRQ